MFVNTAFGLYFHLGVDLFHSESELHRVFFDLLGYTLYTEINKKTISVPTPFSVTFINEGSFLSKGSYILKWMVRGGGGDAC